MPRIAIPTEDQIPDNIRASLAPIKKRFGFIPNLHRLMALSEAALTGWLNLQAPLSKSLDLKTREAMALAVAEANGCEYCVAAHGHVANAFAKVPVDEILRNRQGHSIDGKVEAAATFARRLIETRGKVTDVELTRVRAAGYSEPQIIEIVSLCAQFLLTNFMNNVADTEIDFPPLRIEAAG